MACRCLLQICVCIGRVLPSRLNLLDLVRRRIHDRRRPLPRATVGDGGGGGGGGGNSGGSAELTAADRHKQSNGSSTASSTTATYACVTRCDELADTSSVIAD